MYMMQIAADTRKRETANNFYSMTRDKYEGNAEEPQGQTNPLVGNNLPTEDKGGIISNEIDFFAFMWDQAKNNPKEVAAWKILDKQNNLAFYFVLPWMNNLSDQSVWDIQSFNNAGFSWNSYSIGGDYHTHPRSAGPSYDDFQRTLKINYPTHTIGADGRVWETFIMRNNVIPGRYIEMKGMNPNVYRYGRVIKQIK